MKCSMSMKWNTWGQCQRRGFGEQRLRRVQYSRRGVETSRDVDYHRELLTPFEDDTVPGIIQRFNQSTFYDFFVRAHYLRLAIVRKRSEEKAIGRFVESSSHTGVFSL